MNEISDLVSCNVCSSISYKNGMRKVHP